MKRSLAAAIRELTTRTGQELEPEVQALLGSTAPTNRGEAAFWDLLTREGTDIPLPRCTFHGGQATLRCDSIGHRPNIYSPDFYWPAARLVVEIDGGVHTLKRQQREDCFRKNNMTLAGYTVLTFTPQMVEWNYRACLNYVRKALGLPLKAKEKA